MKTKENTDTECVEYFNSDLINFFQTLIKFLWLATSQ